MRDIDLSNVAFLRVALSAGIREVVGTAPNMVEQRRAMSAASQSLWDSYAGEKLSMYVPKVGTEARARRGREIRARWTGDNAAFLAAQYGISERQVRRIVGGKPTG